jgi:hypothetical protein
MIMAGCGTGVEIEEDVDVEGVEEIWENKKGIDADGGAEREEVKKLREGC